MPAPRDPVRATGRPEQTPWRALVPILGVALVFRLAMASQTIVHQPDEIWQYLEPAWGRLTGHWIVAWEFHEGIRGWLVPMLLTPSLALGHAIAPDTMLHLWLTRGLLGLLSLGVVASFFAMGERISRQHAIVAGWVGAVWVEIFYFAARPSGEGIALSLAMPALYLAMRLRERPSIRLAGILGLLLGLTFIVRFQYAPALALIGLLAVSGDPRRTLLPLAGGSLVAIALGALADMAAGAPPLLWLWRNFAINLGENRSASFGTQPPWWFVTQIGATWHIAMLVLLPSLLTGARRFPFVALIALVVIASHSLIPHKEYRFVILAIALGIFLAAIGSVDLWKALAGRWRVAERINATIALCVLWFLLSAVVGATKPFSAYWGNGRAANTMLAKAGRTPGICGLALFQEPDLPMANYTYLNRSVPVMLLEGRRSAASAQAMAPAFNVIIAPRLSAPELPASYRQVECLQPHKAPEKQKFCLLMRPGACTMPPGDFDYNTVLRRLGH